MKEIKEANTDVDRKVKKATEKVTATYEEAARRVRRRVLIAVMSYT